ncbi:MAG: TonB-dependent receptor [Bacteroidota bacterium]
MRILQSILLVFVLNFSLSAQNGILRGKVIDKSNRNPVPFAPVGIPSIGLGAVTDSVGVYSIERIPPGLYNVEVSVIGYQPLVVYEVQISGSRAKLLDLELEEASKVLQEVEVRPDPFVRVEEAPVSAYNIGEVEVKRSPGSNRDVSKALQSLPGVAATASFRNDLIIRGGATNENRFYLDGVEVPNINHFSTQGATGGPVGMINVDFVRDVDFYSSSFPAQRGNMLSSLLDFKLKDGRSDKTGFALTLGATDLAATVDGPIGKNATYIASWRRSYLQFLFQALGLPFLPRYDDFLFKTRYKIDQRNEVSVVALGAIDKVTLNKKDNETDFQKYVLGYLPENDQWNYTVGATYRHYGQKGYSTLVISRNELQNGAVKYQNNDESAAANLLLDYSSRETENKMRFEHTLRMGRYKVTAGAGMEQASYSTSTFNRIPYVGTVLYESKIDLFKYAAFGQVTGQFLQDKLTLSVGIRADGNDFNRTMRDPLSQFSPRAGLSLSLTEWLRLNASTGRYYQMPTYTLLGYRNNADELVNKAEAKYIKCDHIVAGFEITNRKSLRITLEGFYKYYSDYPFNLRDSISIANQGNDFGVIGNTPVRFDNQGRSYGAEVMVQQRFNGNFYGIIAYTLLKSEFQDFNSDYIPSSWDFRNTLSLTGGYYFKRNWELGMRFRYNSGQPYTPYDTTASMYIGNWDVTGVGIPDKSRINSERTAAFKQLDVRIDKKYFFRKWSLDLYLDIQNLLNYKTRQQPYLSVERDPTGAPVVNPIDPASYLPYYIPNESGSVIPTLGFVLEF